jgi:hypothetical protein
MFRYARGGDIAFLVFEGGAHTWTRLCILPPFLGIGCTPVLRPYRINNFFDVLEREFVLLRLLKWH